MQLRGEISAKLQQACQEVACLRADSAAEVSTRAVAWHRSCCWCGLLSS